MDSLEKEFDEDKILKQYKKKSKKSVRREIKYYDTLLINIEINASKYFNCDLGYKFYLRPSDIFDIENKIKNYFSILKENIKLCHVRTYLIYNSNDCKDDENFDNYCMLVFNMINGYRIELILPDESYSGYCDICFEDKTNIKRLPCNHSLCHDCIKENYIKKMDPSCPFCRTKVEKTKKKMITDNFITPLTILEYHSLINDTYHFMKKHSCDWSQTSIHSHLLYFANCRDIKTDYIEPLVSYDRIVRSIERRKIPPEFERDLRINKSSFEYKFAMEEY